MAVAEVIVHPMERAIDGILQILDHARCSVCTRLPLSFGSISVRVVAWGDDGAMVPRLKLIRRDDDSPESLLEEHQSPWPKHNLSARRRKEIRAIFDNLDRDHNDRVSYAVVVRVDEVLLRSSMALSLAALPMM